MSKKHKVRNTLQKQKLIYWICWSSWLWNNCFVWKLQLGKKELLAHRKGCGYSSWWITIKAEFFRLSHDAVTCDWRRFDCILLVFFRRWGRLVMRDLIKHDALPWSVVFSTALIGAFLSLLFAQCFAPSAVRCRTAPLLLCFLILSIHASGI